MLCLGADDEEQLAKALHHHEVGGSQKAGEGIQKLTESLLDPKDGAEFLVANSLWADGDVKQEYVASVRDVFAAQVNKLQGVDEVNAWCSRNTKGYIKQILEELDPDTVLVLANAVFFKGAWALQFDKSLTSRSTFKCASGKSTKVMMMQHKERALRYAELEEGQVCVLDYEKSRFSMAVILPSKKTSSVSKLLESEGANCLSKWINAASARRPSKGTLWMPRLDVDFKTNLIPTLKTMGVQKIFRVGALERIAKLAEVDQAVHRAIIKLDEEGTVAAAVTAVAVKTRSLRRPPPPWTMNCNRPFVLSIFDRTSKLITFVGAIQS